MEQCREWVIDERLAENGLTAENRLEYTVENDSIVVLSCRGHYED